MGASSSQCKQISFSYKLKTRSHIVSLRPMRLLVDAPAADSLYSLLFSAFTHRNSKIMCIFALVGFTDDEI